MNIIKPMICPECGSPLDENGNCASCDAGKSKKGKNRIFRSQSSRNGNDNNDDSSQSLVRKSRIACPKCGAAVFNGEAKCSECGYDVRPLFKRPIGVAVIIVAVVSVIAFGISKTALPNMFFGTQEPTNQEQQSNGDGTNTTDGTTAMDLSAQDFDVKQLSVEDIFEINNIKIAVHAPAAPAKYNDLDCFEVHVTFFNDTDAPTMGDMVMFNVFGPNGAYTIDETESAKMEKIINAAQNSTDSTTEEQAENDIHPEINPHEVMDKDMQILYNGPGTYTIEAKDYLNKTAYRIQLQVE